METSGSTIAQVELSAAWVYRHFISRNISAALLSAMRRMNCCSQANSLMMRIPYGMRYRTFIVWYTASYMHNFVNHVHSFIRCFRERPKREPQTEIMIQSRRSTIHIELNYLSLNKAPMGMATSITASPPKAAMPRVT